MESIFVEEDFNPSFSYFAGNIKDSSCKGLVTLEKFLKAIVNPKPETKAKLDLIRKATAEGNQDLKNKLKTQLYSFTPCVAIPTHKRRKLDNINNFTGLVSLDFDKLDSEKVADEFKEYLFNKYKWIIAAWKSSSGKGVRAIGSIPYVYSRDEFRLYYDAIELELQGYAGYDKAPRNCVLPLFISHDPNLLFRDYYKIFRQTFDKEKFEREKLQREFEKIKVNRAIKGSISDSIKTSKSIEFIQEKLRAVSNCGHPIVRATAYSIGGLIQNDYITEHEAMTTFEIEIKSHFYLSEKASTYMQTVKDMIKEGRKKPYELKID